MFKALYERLCMLCMLTLAYSIKAYYEVEGFVKWCWETKSDFWLIWFVICIMSPLTMILARFSSWPAFGYTVGPVTMLINWATLVDAYNTSGARAKHLKEVWGKIG